MSADLPHTLYPKRDKKGKEGTTVTDDVLAKQEEANRRALERRIAANKDKEVTLEELFNE